MLWSSAINFLKKQYFNFVLTSSMAAFAVLEQFVQDTFQKQKAALFSGIKITAITFRTAPGSPTDMILFGKQQV